MSSLVWKNEIEYERILEILEDYWLCEPDEAAVVVDLYFEHQDGRVQEKRITWRNPALSSESMRLVDLRKLI